MNIQSSIVEFIKAQKQELLNQGYFKTYTHCKNCGTKFIFKNNDIKTKRVCICQSNDWIIDRLIEC